MSLRELTHDDAREIRRLHRNGLSKRLLSVQYQTSQVSIRRICDHELFPDRPVRYEPPPPPVDPVKLYHDEKAKRDERLKRNPRLAAAEQAFKAQMAREKELRKGGRPKKGAGSYQLSVGGKPNQFPNVSRPTDLADLLPPYFGRSA